MFGSISSAIIVCRLMGFADPRTVGSKNPGATNVYRTASKKAAIVTLFGDMIKGLIPVLIALLFSHNALLISLVGLAAFLGHLYPVFFKFQGGKGVATSLGVFVAWYWLFGLIVLAIWMLVYLISRISSLSALIAALLAPIIGWYLLQDINYTIAIATITILLYWRHRTNIKQLLSRTEN